MVLPTLPVAEERRKRWIETKGEEIIPFNQSSRVQKVCRESESGGISPEVKKVIMVVLNYG